MNTLSKMTSSLSLQAKHPTELVMCFFLGDKGDAIVPEGIEHIERPSTTLYSPRTPNYRLADDGGIRSDGSVCPKFYYATRKENYKNIYEFVFACRASKLTDNYYLYGLEVPTSVADLRDRAVLLGGSELYNLVSGDKLPTTMAPLNRQLIHRYMLMGLHYFATYSRCGLGETKVLQEQTQSRIVSAGRHIFTAEQGWVLNVSNIFIGSLIDYYRIESGIVGMNGQLSFVKEPEYRYLVYKYLKAVFVAFVKHNLAVSEVSEKSDDAEIVTSAAKLITDFLCSG